jgi:transcriptional regulator with GAF, ATPase, and Fis domain
VKQPEAWLARTFTQLADRLTAPLDIVEFLTTVAERAAELVGAAEVGILLADQGGMLTAVASSSDHVRIIELLELQNRDGPGLACYRSGEQVVNILFDEDAHAAWPTFGPRASKEGFGGIHTLPLRLPEVVIGVVSILHVRPRELGGRELEFAQSLANLATVGVLQQRQSSPNPAHLADQLQAALDARVVIDYAKGLVAQRLTVDVDTALELMRTYRRTEGTRLDDLARAIVRARFAPEELLRQSRTASVRPRAG